MTIQTRILAAMLAAAGFQAYAEDAPPEGAPPPRGPRPPFGDMFEKKDADKDGKLTLVEFKSGMPEERAAKADEYFKKIDANSDGAIDKEEMKKRLVVSHKKYSILPKSKSLQISKQPKKYPSSKESIRKKPN